MLISLKKLGHSCSSVFAPSMKPLVNFTKLVSWRYFTLYRLLYFLS